MSAKLLFSPSSYSSSSGMRQHGSSALRAAASSFAGQRIVGREQPRVVVAERDHAGTGQRRDVDHGAGLKRSA